MAEVEELAFEIAKKHLDFNEPIPDFSSRFPHKLESCLAVPFQKFSGMSPYPTLTEKTGILFYLMIKDHPFQNGNKRIAITTMFLLLLKNKKWLDTDLEELYDLTIDVAKSKAEDKNLVVQAVNWFISSNLIDGDPVSE